MSAGIKGVELGNRVLRRPVKQDPHMAVFIANVGIDHSGGNAEPTLIVGRHTMGKGRSWMIPLSSAWMYNVPEMLDEKAELAADYLFAGFASKSEKHLVADVFLQYLPELFPFAPDEQAKALHNGLQTLLSQYKVKITDKAGNVIVDASESAHRD